MTNSIKAVETVNEHLQGIQNYLGQGNRAEGRIRFPRGYIRTAGHFRSDLGFVTDDDLKRNLSYALILSDVLRWLINRTDLFGIAREMVVKIGIVLMGSICEALCVNATAGVIGRRYGFCERANRMQNKGIINEELRNDLNWLWERRAGIHIYELTIREHQTYSIRDYNRAVRAGQRLRKALGTHR